MNYKRRISMLIAISMVFTLAVSGCGKKEKVILKDGVYEGSYKDDDGGNMASYVDISFTVKNGKIVSCYSQEFMADGKPKDEHYGESAGAQNFAKAQVAFEGMKEYPNELVAKQDIDKVDAISGATISFKRFVEAVKNAKLVKPATNK